ncbi:MAG: hypothetical protein K5739_12875 [Lachnospiraceae bacterium]|nr:hypothetical protein [Lachnospiraceae bacterium]
MLKKLNIRQKLLLNSIPLAVMILVLIALMWMGEMSVLKQSRSVYYEELKEITDKLITADRDFYQAMLAQENIHMAKKRADAKAEDEGREMYAENAQRVEEGIADIQKLLASDAYLYQTFRGADIDQSCEELITTTIENFAKWKVEADRDNIDAAEMLFPDARSGLNDLEEVLGVYTDYQDKQLEKSIHRSLLITIFIIVLILVAMTLLTIYVIRYIRLNIKRIEESLNALANGKFIKMDDSDVHKDEMGSMIVSTNSLMDKLQEIIGHIKDSAGQIDSSSASLAETAEQISYTSDGVSDAVAGISSGAMQQAEEIQSANKNVGLIAESVSNVIDHSESLADTARNMEGESKACIGDLEKLRESSDDMSARIVEITDRINATSQAVGKINEKVAAINAIATQTNLLALNASIEAARAGEAGRGFAVVAEEIGKLADDSAMSANDIRSEMEILLGESKSAVKAAKEVQDSNQSQQEIIRHTAAGIENMIGAIDTTVSGIGSISSSAKESVQAKDAVVDVMSSLSAISEENAASTQETSASMMQMNETVGSLARSADDLKILAGDLKEQISFFED